MSLLFHLAFAICYAVLAVAVALTLPYSLPQVERPLSLVLGALVFLFGAVLHEVYARSERDKAMVRHFARLHNAIDAAKAEAARLDGEIAALRRSIDDAGAPTAASELEAVAAEVRSLRSLLGARTAARSPAPSSAASQFPAPHAPHARPAAPGKGPAKPAAGAAARPGAPRLSIMAAVAGSPTIAGAPGAAALAAAVPAAVLDDAAMLGRIREALEADRVDILLQPIVSLPQRKHRYYEVFSRLRCADGSELLPEQYLPVAARENFLAVIDTLLLFRCFQLIRETERRNYGVGFVCNISTAALGDPAFMDQFVQFMGQNPGLAPRLVFELPEAELVGAGGGLAGGMLSGLAGLDIHFSMDQVEHADFDVNLLARHGVRYVKLEAGRILDARHGLGLGGLRRTISLKENLDRHHIDLIVEKVETEQQLAALVDLRIDYGQGFLFGEPRLSRKLV